MDGRIAVNIAVEACQEVIDDSPWLGFIVADVLDADAGLFHNFTLNSFLEGLADLGKSGDEGIEGDIAARIFGQQDLVIVDDTYDDSRDDAGINSPSAGSAFHSPLCLGMDRPAAAGPAVAIVTVPVGELVGCDRRKETMLGAVSLGPHGADVFKYISLRDILVGQVFAQQEKSAPIHGKEEGVLHLYAELFYLRKAQIASSLFIEAFFIHVFARHTDLAVLTTLVYILKHCVLFALHDQKICLAENKDRALGKRI